MAASVTYLPRGVLLQIETQTSPSSVFTSVSEHNRQPIQVSTNRIEQTTRMSNGTLRKFFIADKKQFSISWTMLPATTSYTADGYWGAKNLIDFYDSSTGQGTFRIKLNYAQQGTESFTTYTVNCTSFSSTLVKRGAVAHWDISMTLEEV
jgi:hypothetical protein